MDFKKILFIFFIIVFASCQDKKEPVKKVKIKINNVSYFDFDSIAYYKFLKPRRAVLNKKVKFKNELVKIENLAYYILTSDYPRTITDSTFIKTLELTGFNKKIVDKSRYVEINRIFSENNKCKHFNIASCSPMYRDIFVFMKNRNVIGIAKICFTCRLFHIVGTEKNVAYFGQCGGYEKLETLFHE